MEISERDGKFFLKLSNGELELTEKQVESMVERGAVIRNNLRNWVENFNYRHWQVSKVPNIAEQYIKADEYFDNIIRELEDIYHSAGSKGHTGERIMEFCTLQIQNLKKDIEKSKDPAFAEYAIACWLRVAMFIKSLANITAPALKELVA